MSEWHFIPLTIQYIISGSISLALAFLVIYKNRSSASAKLFMCFALLLAGWQFMMFLHRNAPNTLLSKVFLVTGTGFASLMLPALFLTVSFLQNGSKKYFIVIIPNLIFLLFLFFYEPFEIFWTEFGWSYIFKHELASYALFPLTVFYIALNYAWIMKPIMNSKVPFIKKKYKFILFGFTTLFIIGVTIFNTILLPVFPSAPPIGGIAACIGLFLISYGILLKEKIQVHETPLLIAQGELFKKSSLFLQKFFNSIYEGGLGQRHLKFERYLKNAGIEDYVSFKNGRVILLKEPAPSQIVKILDNALSYLEKGDVKDEILSDVLELWNSLHPLIEVDTISLIKAHEKYIRERKLIYEIAGGRFRSLFLPKDFSEKDLDIFSQQIGVTHKELFGNPILAEFNPSEKYEKKVEAYIFEVLANNERLAVFSRRGSRILTVLPSGYGQQICLYYLSPSLSKKVVISDYEIDLPLYDLTRLLGEIHMAINEQRSILIDNLTDLIYSLDFKRAYKFTRHALELAASFRAPALFLIAETHDEKIKSAFENLFPLIIKIKGNRILRVK